MPEQSSLELPAKEAPSSSAKALFLHSGEKLNVAEASSIMSNVPVTMVLCAGAQWAGKSTFLARIGELFRAGSYSEVSFHESKTLLAFDRLSWHATLASGRECPETLRSHHSEKDLFLHLAVRDELTHSSRQILICDLPGELYGRAVASQEFCKEHSGLMRANHILLFVDCHSLVDRAKRHSERDKADKFLYQLAKARQSSNLPAVTVVYSRADYLEGPSSIEANEYCDHLGKEISSRYSEKFKSLHFTKVAARPDRAPPTDVVIQKLLYGWLDRGSPAAEDAPCTTAYVQTARDFTAFGTL